MEVILNTLLNFDIAVMYVWGFDDFYICNTLLNQQVQNLYFVTVFTLMIIGRGKKTKTNDRLANGL